MTGTNSTQQSLNTKIKKTLAKISKRRLRLAAKRLSIRLEKEDLDNKSALIEKISKHPQEKISAALKPTFFARHKNNIFGTVGVVGTIATLYAIFSTPHPSPEKLELNWYGFVQRETEAGWRSFCFQDGMQLFDDDEFRIVLNANQSCFLYLLNRDVRGDIHVLFPNSQISFGNGCDSGKNYQVPDGDNWFQISGEPGAESILIVASVEPINEIEKLKTKSNGKDAWELVSTLEEAETERTVQIGMTRNATTQLRSGEKVTADMTLIAGQGRFVETIEFEHLGKNEY